jgi:hypothetical protein
MIWEPTVSVSRDDLIRERQLIDLAADSGGRDIAITFDAMMSCWRQGLDPEGVVRLCLCRRSTGTHQVQVTPTGGRLKVVVEEGAVYTIMLPNED